MPEFNGYLVYSSEFDQENSFYVVTWTHKLIHKINFRFCREISPLKRMTENEELRSLVTHPVLSSFLFLKWSKLSFLFYTNLLVFSIFMTTFIIYIVMSQTMPFEERDNSLLFQVLKFSTFVLLWVLILREFSQLILSYEHYVKSLINWFEVGLIVLAWVVLSDYIEIYAYQRQLRAVLILFAALEFLNIIGNLPILSVSTHMVMLKRVTITFFKSIALYSILILSFGLVFFSLYGEDQILKEKDPEDEQNMKFEHKHHEESNITSRFGDEGCPCPDETETESNFTNFRTPGIALVRTLIMLTGKRRR